MLQLIEAEVDPDPPKGRIVPMMVAIVTSTSTLPLPRPRSGAATTSRLSIARLLARYRTRIDVLVASTETGATVARVLAKALGAPIIDTANHSAEVHGERETDRATRFGFR